MSKSLAASFLGIGMRRVVTSSACHVGRFVTPSARRWNAGACRSDRPSPRTTNITITKPVRRCYSSSGRDPASSPQPPPQKLSTPNASARTRLLGRYSDLLTSRPLTTKAITSGIIAGAGDLTCQLLAAHFVLDDLEENGEEEVDNGDDGEIPEAWATTMDVDWGRCARFTLLGAGFLAPCLHYWYTFLGKAIPGVTLTTVVKRVALDQLVFTPVFLMSFLSANMLVDGQAAKIVPKLKADYIQTLVGNWGYWIPAQVINFRFVPAMYQVLCANGFGFVWNIYLSFQSNKAVEAVEDGNANQEFKPDGP